MQPAPQMLTNQRLAPTSTSCSARPCWCGYVCEYAGPTSRLVCAKALVVPAVALTWRGLPGLQPRGDGPRHGAREHVLRRGARGGAPQLIVAVGVHGQQELAPSVSIFLEADAST